MIHLMRHAQYTWSSLLYLGYMSHVYFYFILCLWLKSAAEHANSGISLNKIVFVTHRDAVGF